MIPISGIIYSCQQQRQVLLVQLLQVQVQLVQAVVQVLQVVQVQVPVQAQRQHCSVI